MKIANFVHDSIVDGPGLRFTLFTQGCPHRCEGCHNEHTHDPGGGKEMSADEIIDEFNKNPLTDGITLSGGEPFSQAEDCIKLAQAAKESGLSVWAYSGWLFDELLSGVTPRSAELLRLCDVLVDGKFVLAQRSLMLKWRGSKNQRVIDVQKTLAAGEITLWERQEYI